MTEQNGHIRAPGETRLDAEVTEEMRRELVRYLRDERETLRGQWVEAMKFKGLTEGLTEQETETESATIYDTCVDCLDSGQYDAAEVYAQSMAERGVLRGMSPEEIIGGMLTLRDVYGRSLFQRYESDKTRLSDALDVYEPVANEILNIVAMAFISEREKIVRQQQEAIMELSTPVLQVRQGMLILPIVGLLDSNRAQQFTEQLLRGIRATRARVAVVDITGVPAVDSRVANHLLQTVDASKLMGASVVVTGLSPEIAQTLVSLGIDLGRMTTVGDLQGGIEEAERLLGYEVTRNTEDAVIQ
ncbi:STAS domain-containing protein [soil metagenome]